MPLINVSLLEGRSVEAKRKYASEITKLTCDCFEVTPERVRIVFSEMKPENFAVAGVLNVDKK